MVEDREMAVEGMEILQRPCHRERAGGVADGNIGQPKRRGFG